jgi:glycosyltransferase involved in cell wall biosynthesis
MELMRVLHVHSGNLYGGVETVLTTLARPRNACPEMQHQFALCFEGRLSNELANLGTFSHSIGAVRASRPLSVVRGRRRLREVISAGFDAIVFHSAWSHALFAPVARAAGIPSIVWMHGTAAGKHWTERWARRTDPALVLCNSQFTAGGAAVVYPKIARQVLYSPVELSSVELSSAERRKIRAELNTPHDSVVIIQVGRMERLKGQLLHLEVLGTLKKLQGWTCWFAGGPQRPEEGRYFTQIVNAATRFGIADRVRFLDERSDVPKLLKAADIYCQPNVQPESFGITFVEAFNAALPVVTTSIGGANEIVDDTCGILVRPGNVADIAEALTILIEDPALRSRLGQQGPARAQKLCEPVARIKQLSGILTNAVSRGIPS